MPEKTEIGSAMIPADTEALDAFKSGVADANRRERGDFDGLLGQFDPTSSELLRDILSDIREYLLERTRNDGEARALIDEYEPRVGFRNVTPIPDDVALAVRLLNRIRSAAKCDAEKFAKLVLGAGGARDKKRQAGTHKKRRPEITTWINTQLDRNPDAKSPALWAAAPDWITDDIGARRFATRVTACRKSRASN
ncbi:MAG: hypothetical protein JSS59_06780 [Proteobacteria bacterium]|uniref:hypothetical protein n=1 Tax=Rudaea sp. TaxID=2136325 RepID=UPI003782E65A|nr:hypothetical protein [Pseudomonadota bacterium]